MEHGSDGLFRQEGVEFVEDTADSILSLEHSLKLRHGAVNLKLGNVRMLCDRWILRLWIEKNDHEKPEVLQRNQRIHTDLTYQNTKSRHFSRLAFKV